jgi:hypothetical protein
MIEADAVEVGERIADCAQQMIEGARGGLHDAEYSACAAPKSWPGRRGSLPWRLD